MIPNRLRQSSNNGRFGSSGTISDNGSGNSCYDNRHYELPKLSIAETTSYLATKAFFSDQLREDNVHYQALNATFKRIFNLNDNVAQDAYGRIGYFCWDSFRFKYDISEIRQSAGYDNAERHLSNGIAKYTETVTDLEASTQVIDNMIDQTRKKIEEKIKNEFKGFKLIYDEEKKEYAIVSILREYWMSKLLHRYRTERIPYQELIRTLEPPSVTDKETEHLMAGARHVALLPLDKEEFTKRLMKLARDYEIWDSILDIVRKREEIGDKAKTLARGIQEIIRDIENQRYRVRLDCCPSKQIADSG